MGDKIQGNIILFTIIYVYDIINRNLKIKIDGKSKSSAYNPWDSATSIYIHL